MELQTLSRALAHHPLVNGLSRPHLDFLCGCAANVRFREGELLFREGDEAGSLYLIRHGKVALSVEAPPRGTLALERIDSGGMIGWSVIYPPYRWPVDARAISDTLAFAIDGDCLRNKLERDHEFGYAFLRLLLRDVHQRLDRARLQQIDAYRVEP